jgi:hypothetical protein
MLATFRTSEDEQPRVGTAASAVRRAQLATRLRSFAPRTVVGVSSSMTSFTQCSGTSFTLPRDSCFPVGWPCGLLEL